MVDWFAENAFSGALVHAAYGAEDAKRSLGGKAPYAVCDEGGRADAMIKIKNNELKNNIFAIYDVEIDKQKCYGDDDILSDLTKKEYVELVSMLTNFKEGLIIM